MVRAPTAGGQYHWVSEVRSFPAVLSMTATNFHKVREPRDSEIC